MSSGRVVPARLTQARELAGQSKTQVATALNVSGAAVTQWESGGKRPTHENLAALSRHLDVPLTLFFRDLPSALTSRGPLSFRAWQSASTRQANRKATRQAELTAEIFAWLDERVTLPTPVLPPPLGKQGGGVDAEVDVEAAAKLTRQTWGLGERPLLKLGELLESRGVFLCPATFGDDRFDAFSCVLGGRAFLFLGNEKQDRARSRFDAAHELGHLVLHRHLDAGELRESGAHALAEAQANRFASAFLLPATTFGADVRETDLHGFLNLKPRWAVSVQSMVVRARELGLISPERYGELFKQMGWRRWRQAQGEPLDDQLPAIAGSFASRSLRLLVQAGQVQAWEVPELLGLPLPVVQAVLGLSDADLEPASPGLKAPKLFSAEETPFHLE